MKAAAKRARGQRSARRKDAPSSSPAAAAAAAAAPAVVEEEAKGGGDVRHALHVSQVWAQACHPAQHGAEVGVEGFVRCACVFVCVRVRVWVWVWVWVWVREQKIIDRNEMK